MTEEMKFDLVSLLVINERDGIFYNLDDFDLSSESKLKLANQVLSKDPVSTCFIIF